MAAEEQKSSDDDELRLALIAVAAASLGTARATGSGALAASAVEHVWALSSWRLLPGSHVAAAELKGEMRTAATFNLEEHDACTIMADEDAVEGIFDYDKDVLKAQTGKPVEMEAETSLERMSASTEGGHNDSEAAEALAGKHLESKAKSQRERMAISTEGGHDDSEAAEALIGKHLEPEAKSPLERIAISTESGRDDSEAAEALTGRDLQPKAKSSLEHVAISTDGGHDDFEAAEAQTGKHPELMAKSSRKRMAISTDGGHDDSEAAEALTGRHLELMAKNSLERMAISTDGGHDDSETAEEGREPRNVFLVALGEEIVGAHVAMCLELDAWAAVSAVCRCTLTVRRIAPAIGGPLERLSSSKCRRKLRVQPSDVSTDEVSTEASVTVFGDVFLGDVEDQLPGNGAAATPWDLPRPPECARSHDEDRGELVGPVKPELCEGKMRENIDIETRGLGVGAWRELTGRAAAKAVSEECKAMLRDDLSMKGMGEVNELLAEFRMAILAQGVSESDAEKWLTAVQVDIADAFLPKQQPSQCSEPAGGSRERALRKERARPWR